MGDLVEVDLALLLRARSRGSGYAMAVLVCTVSVSMLLGLCLECFEVRNACTKQQVPTAEGPS